METRWLKSGGGLVIAVVLLAMCGCTSSGDLTTLANSVVDSASSVLADAVAKVDTSSEESDGTSTDSEAADGAGEFRGPPGGPGHLAELLSLTEEQQTQAEAIHEQMRTDIEALIEPAEQQLLEILTDEQETQLDGRYGILLGLPPHHEGPPPGPPPTAEEIAAAEADPNFVPPHRGGPPPMGGPGGPGGPMGGGHGPGMGPPPGPPPTLEDLAIEFALTDEQVTQITAIRDALQTEIEAVHEASKTQFKALLTAEQLVIFEELEANRPAPPAFGE